MHRFILAPEALLSDKVLLDPRESHHAKNVLRVKAGEAVEVLDGRGGRFAAVIEGFEGGRVALLLDRKAPVPAEDAEVRITLAPAVIKPERMEWMLEKSCELGVREWLPVLTERSVVKLSRERWQAKLVRWRKIALESCKQCGQPHIPQVREPVSFGEIVKRIPSYDAAFIPTLSPPVSELHEALARSRKAGEILILIGPEGDFSAKETKAALDAGAVAVSLGSRVLRAETAALYTVSVAQFFYGSERVRAQKKA